MDSNKQRFISPKKWFYGVFIGALSIAGLTGITALLTGEFDWLEVRILLSTTTILGGSITAYSCVAGWKKHQRDLLMFFGVLTSVFGVLLGLTAVWMEGGSEWFGKTLVTVWVLAGSTAHISLLTLASLRTKYHWVLVSGITSSGLLALMGIVIVLGEYNGEWWFRFVGVFSILVAVFTILIPVFHRISNRNKAERKQESTDQDRVPNHLYVRFSCPECDHSESYPPGEISCSSCGNEIKIRIVNGTGKDRINSIN